MYFDDPLSGKRICGQVIDTCVLLSCHVPNTQIGLNRDCLPLKESKIFFLQYVRVCSIHICFCQTSHFVYSPWWISFSVSRKSTLKTHIASIHEGIKYPCDLCTYAATQKSALKRHMRTIHNPGDLMFQLQTFTAKIIALIKISYEIERKNW